MNVQRVLLNCKVYVHILLDAVKHISLILSLMGDKFEMKTSRAL